MTACKNTKLIILSFLLFIYSEVKSQTNEERHQLVTGKVTHNQLPLKSVSISIKNSDIGSKTDKNGNFTIKTHKNDTLIFSHLGFTTIEKKVGNKKNINIEMTPEVYILEETLLKKVKKRDKNIKESDKAFTTSKENVDPRSIGYRVSYFKGNEVSGYKTITNALLAKVPNYKVKQNLEGQPVSHIRNLPVLWDIDGFVTEIEPFLIMSEVEDIRILGPAAAVNYGQRCNGVGGVGSLRGCGGIILVKMKKGTDTKPPSVEEQKRINTILNNIQGNNNYESTTKYITSHSKTIEKIDNIDRAYDYCLKILTKKRRKYFDDFSLINYFFESYKNKHLFMNLANKYLEKYKLNQNAIRILGYEFEALNFKENYLDIYKKNYTSNNKNPINNRNLANALIDNSEYKKAWQIYNTYIKNNKKISSKNIDQLIFNETEWLYHNKKEHIITKYKFSPKHNSKDDFHKDIRLIIEWSNPEIVFNIGFNNTTKEPFLYKYDHSKDKNIDSFPIEEFLITGLDDSNWDINLTYFDNKKNKPTLFKVTCYYNWGKDNQFKETKTYLMEGEYMNTKILSLDKESLKNPQ